MTNYSKTMIYKIICNDPEVTDVYVGHTTDFRLRRNKHKSICNNNKSKHHNLLIYKIIRNNGGWENWSMVVVEQFPCYDIYEAIAREGYWYKELNGTMNACVPSRTKKDSIKAYHQTNKEQIAEQRKQYRQINKEQIAEKKKEQMECECGVCFRKDSKTRHQKSKKHLDYLKIIKPLII